MRPWKLSLVVLVFALAGLYVAYGLAMHVRDARDARVERLNQMIKEQRMERLRQCRQMWQDPEKVEACAND